MPEVKKSVRAFVMGGPVSLQCFVNRIVRNIDNLFWQVYHSCCISCYQSINTADIHSFQSSFMSISEPCSPSKSFEFVDEKWLAVSSCVDLADQNGDNHSDPLLIARLSSTNRKKRTIDTFLSDYEGMFHNRWLFQCYTERGKRIEFREAG